MPPSDYIVKHGVPIVDEHVMYDDEGNPLVRIDHAVLSKIARKNNERVRLTGDEVPIIIGHTRGEPGDFVPEQEQPEIVGYARDFRVAPFFKTGKRCVTATFKLMKRYAGKIAKYPRRSIEIWLGDWKVDPIALLGATTPSRDLGLLRLAADGRKVYRRVLPAKDSMNPEALAQAIVKALEQTDVFQYCKKKMQEEGDQAGLEDEGGMGGLEGGEGLPPEEDEEAPGGHTDIDSHNVYGAEDGETGEDGAEADLSEEQEEGKAPVKMSGASTASGTNSFTPGLGRKPAKKVNYSRAGHQDRVRLSRSEQEKAQLRKEVQSMRLRLSRVEREKDLLALENEGVEFDLNEELEDGLQLSDAQWAKHLGKIRKRYGRSLTATTDWNAHARTQATSGITSAAQAQEVAEYARGKKISYEQARQELGLD